MVARSTARTVRCREPLGRIKAASPVFGLAVVVSSLAGRPEPHGFGYCWAALTINDLIPGLFTSV